MLQGVRTTHVSVAAPVQQCHGEMGSGASAAPRQQRWAKWAPATERSREPNSVPSHKCEGEKLVFYLVQQKPSKGGRNSSLMMIQKAYGSSRFLGKGTFLFNPSFCYLFLA